MFETLQDRLPKELKLAGIASVEAPNRWLSESYIAEHNARFAIRADQEGSAFVADRKEAWREILCVQEDRTVGNDHTVKWQRLSLQPQPARSSSTPIFGGMNTIAVCRKDSRRGRAPLS